MVVSQEPYTVRTALKKQRVLIFFPVWLVKSGVRWYVRTASQGANVLFSTFEGQTQERHAYGMCVYHIAHPGTETFLKT
ncbi:unnamed protein product [Chondrus crispus]|uniref:Uncharacterized protein n=1 Tax=Chondrus crispus TaxID=2769 RepID=R7QPY4_CHOCR|nr:unnamed protein product [Chondrus crispus]CDF39521.1 unnamed protein product [Chondrus crispus]|eukprot:XP_005719432.1 unnamed protein product [Chondrus crispus]